ncbi:hypothetical protein P9VFCI_157 [Rhizobium phage P9VFCI]|uniref:Uncharacterized protein n=1 Tax=Rhizobium phage P9VFCI TaxID=2763531 RepID=A0A7G7WXC6_9CAUD|nr:hypothetical protein PP937_gp157 [Rhizobium phage P9VFCI]QNH71870.1 hypothetical protein P9VFCI_157 [Rhizobium phage P9VFCI]
MIERTVLLGMNNPDPKDAFSTKKPGASGARLLSFINEYLIVEANETLVDGTLFEECFQRRNIIDDSDWSFSQARHNKDNVLWSVEMRRVIVFGKGPVEALSLDLNDFEWKAIATTVWCKMPHPSGLNRYYNDSEVRVRAGKILYEEMQNGIALNCWLSQ